MSTERHGVRRRPCGGARIVAGVALVGLVACGSDTHRLFPVLRLVTAFHDARGAPSSGATAVVNGVRRPVLEQPNHIGWTVLVWRVLSRPEGRIDIEVPVPAGFQGARLRLQAQIALISRPIPDTVRAQAALESPEVRTVIRAGLGPMTIAQVDPPVVAGAAAREHLALTLDGAAVDGDALLTVLARPEAEHPELTDPFTVPRRARLRVALGVEHAPEVTIAGAHFALAAVVDGHEEPLLAARLNAAPADWDEREVDLAAYAGRTIQLRFTSEVQAGGEERPPVPVWGDPTVFSEERPAPDARRWNVLLVSLDTLRPDHLGCYGYARPTSPRIDAALARRGTVFTRAYTAFSSTAGSHTTLLTSLDPCVQHFVNANPPPPMRPDAPTLAEILRAHGWETAAFTEDGWVLAVLGFGRGFATYVERVNSVASLPTGDAAGTFGDALAWIGAHRDEPWFVFAHTYQVHTPYTPPAGYLEQIGVDPKREPAVADTDLYDGEIRYTDELLGTLLGGLERLQLDRQTLVVLVSDHGEQFGEHGLTQHGNSLFDTLLRVTLILRAPGVVPAGARVDAQVGLVDVVPTVLDLLGLPPAPSVQGRSVVPLLRGETLPSRTLWAEVPRHRSEVRAQMAARTGDLKWIIDIHSGRGMAFDLRSDPGETHDISARLPAEEPGRIVAEFERHCAALPEQPGAAAPEPALDPAVREKLRALGYID